MKKLTSQIKGGKVLLKDGGEVIATFDKVYVNYVRLFVAAPKMLAALEDSKGAIDTAIKAALI